MAKSYFAILGVASGATPDKVRSAYRRLAKEFHPDYYEGDSGPFREIQEACQENLNNGSIAVRYSIPWCLKIS